MSTHIITILVALPRWTRIEIAAVDRAEKVAAWREVDRRPVAGPTQVSLDVLAPTDLTARSLVRGVLGDLPPGAFVVSTG